MSWARQNRGGYHNGCLRLTDNAYGASNRVSTALRQWYRAKKAGYGHSNRLAPVGAQLFWRTSNPAGHVATYVGRGKVVTNVPGGRIKVMSWSSVDRWGPFLGWAEPYYG
jgi:cell wall-associated NlpC family hydrolase